ncbi:MAG TPA: iron-sulfur cluster assembly protein [bacterium]|nr:iron-sulfur cluster assembly protein [bacterium]
MITRRDVVEILRRIVDPEIGLNIVETGLVYGIDTANGRVRVVMTMTTPACPVTGYLTGEVETTLRESFPEVQAVEVELVWDPPWDPLMMSEDARDRLGWTA